MTTPTTKKHLLLGLLPLALLVLLAGVFFKLAWAITAFSPAAQPTGYVAQDEVTRYDLRSGTPVLFRGDYEKQYWSGNLVAYELNAVGDLATAVQPWSGGAAHQLDQQGLNRKIVTMKSDGTKIPFAWGSLSATQKTDLELETYLNFLRGDRSLEIPQGGTLRPRASVLGDIIHSRPYYVSDSTSGTPAPTVFVGANDGMLHAFNATTGAERWAYVPSMLIPKMKRLAINPYTHDYYVDGSMIVGNIASGASTKRVLAGVLGGGGKGVYALDITGSDRLAPTSEASAASNILWEITSTTINNAASTSYANLGYTYGLPRLAKVSGTDAVIIGNGYNDGGTYKAFLYIINANTGALISAIQAGTSGTATSPNGLSTPKLIDRDNDGNIDTVYAGDLNGTMWKFDLTVSPATATALLVTSPAQPITMTPGVARHPRGGYMVNFATGAMLATTDTTDTSVFSAYGIWDGAPAANDQLRTQTLTERCYTAGTSTAASPCANRVRTVTSNQPNWVAGAGNHKGWKVELPAGEKVVGDGSFIENGRFYISAHNPTVSTLVQSSTVKGENWLMELDYLTGGSKNTPFLDLSGNHVVDSDDRVKSAASSAPVMTTDGIPVGKFIAIGVQSQPILVQLSSLNDTLFNQNPDIAAVTVVVAGTGSGVSGGHFDEDMYYGTTITGAQATATITVGTGGQTSGYPATLGAISVDGVTIVPALTVTDLANGTAISANATTMGSKLTGGFTATVSGTVVTIKAPLGAQFNGRSITIGAGTSQTLVAAAPAVAAVTGVTAVAPTPGRLVITGVNRKQTVSVQCGSTYVGASAPFISLDNGTASLRLDALYTSINKTTNGYATSCVKTLTSGVTSGLDCTIAAPVGVSACSAGFTVASNILRSSNIGPSGGVNAVTAVTGSAAVPQSGWTNFAPALTATAFSSAGLDAGSVGDPCTGACVSKKHFHQYDDTFDVTGVDMLNPSSTTLDLKNGLPSLTQKFKVIAQNQYLNPAVKLHIGKPNYQFDLDFGYEPLKDYVTSSTLSLSSLQTYQRDPNTVWPNPAVTEPTDAQKLAMPKAIGSLAFNLPVDALTAKDWWGGATADVRAGLHPTVTGCVKKAAGATDGNMYQPVIPPAKGVDGPGAVGWNSTTTPATATGVRHNGALVIQIIRDTTPDSAIELSVPSRPEFGWRVKSAQYADYVLAEYTTFWHHPNGKCYSDTGWTKTPDADNSSRSPSGKATGSTDPKIGDLSGGGAASGATGISSVVVGYSPDGSVTTTLITYANGTRATVVSTRNANGTVTIVTTKPDGTTTTVIIANREGELKSGGDERGSQAQTGRISWREMVKP